MSHRIAPTMFVVFASVTIAACHRSEDLGRLPDGGAGSGGAPAGGAGTGGHTGVAGASGPTGSAGTAGPTGAAGSGGTTAGVAGTSGVAGTGGTAAGVAGTGGTTAGAAGKGGTTGAAGTGGAAGVSATGGTGGVKAAAGAGGANAAGGAAGSSATAGASGTDGSLDCSGLLIPLDHPVAATTYIPAVDTVTDAATGLMWQRKVTAADQINLMTTLGCPSGLGGFSDWRLPTVLELATIVDFGVQDPTISSPAFLETPSGYFASSTPVYFPSGLDPTIRWTIDFKTGFTLNGSPTGYVRCVRRDSPKVCFSGPRFRVNAKASAANGVATVDDRMTITSWQQGASLELTWDKAKEYCSSFARLARMPTVKELLSIVDWAAPAAINLEFFPDTLRADYWTSTAVPGSASDVQTVAFGAATYSGTHATPMTEAHPVRCIVSP